MYYKGTQRILAQQSHGCGPLTFLLVAREKTISVDGVKELVEESCALGNGIPEVSAIGEQVVLVQDGVAQIIRDWRRWLMQGQKGAVA